MEETRRSLFSLVTVCCLLAGALLPPPGDGQTQSSAPPSTESHFRVPLPEAGSQSPQTTASTVTGMDGKSKVTSQLNGSGSSSPELPAPTTVGFYITTGPQTITSRNVDNLTANSAEGNQSSYVDPMTATSWTSSSNFMPSDPFQSTETQGTTATPQPKSSPFSTLATTKRTLETMPATDHEAIREDSTAESTSPPSFTDIDRSVLTLVAATTTGLTSEVLSSTFRSHRTTPVETKRLTDDVLEKTSGLHMEDDGENLPSTPTDGPLGEDPLVIAVIFIFIVTVGILALMGFLRYRQRNSRLQFRRLQDLPMDDMMEDTPLSLYSY